MIKWLDLDLHKVLQIKRRLNNALFSHVDMFIWLDDQISALTLLASLNQLVAFLLPYWLPPHSVTLPPLSFSYLCHTKSASVQWQLLLMYLLKAFPECLTVTWHEPLSAHQLSYSKRSFVPFTPNIIYSVINYFFLLHTCPRIFGKLCFLLFSAQLVLTVTIPGFMPVSSLRAIYMLQKQRISGECCSNSSRISLIYCII